MTITVNAIATLVRALNEAQIRYLVVGGLAVIAHGYIRLTTDIDLVIDLEPENALRAMKTITALGYRPKVPVPAESFADPELRRSWIETKDMVVFSFWHPQDSLTLVDCFITEPFSFQHAWDGRLNSEIAPNLSAPFVGLHDLIAMKERAGRPKDLIDLEVLKDFARGTCE